MAKKLLEMKDVVAKARKEFGIADDEPIPTTRQGIRRVLKKNGYEPPYRFTEEEADDLFAHELYEHLSKKASETERKRQIDKRRRKEMEHDRAMRRAEEERLAELASRDAVNNDDLMSDNIWLMQQQIDRQMLRALFEKAFGTFDQEAYESDFREKCNLSDTYDAGNTDNSDRVRIDELEENLADIRNYCSPREA